MAAPVFATNDVPTAAQFNDWLVNVNYIDKASDTSRNTTIVLADDPELTLPVVANSKYLLTCMLIYSASSAAGGDLNVAFSVPASATMQGHITGNVTTGTLNTDDLNTAFVEGTTMSLGVINTASPWSAALLTARLVVAGTAGNITLRWCQAVSSGINTVLRQGSFINLDRRS